MIFIKEVNLNPQKVYTKKHFFLQVKVERIAKQEIQKVPFKLSTKFGGGVINGTNITKNGL